MTPEDSPGWFEAPSGATARVKDFTRRLGALGVPLAALGVEPGEVSTTLLGGSSRLGGSVSVSKFAGGDGRHPYGMPPLSLRFEFYSNTVTLTRGAPPLGGPLQRSVTASVPELVRVVGAWIVSEILEPDPTLHGESPYWPPCSPLGVSEHACRCCGLDLGYDPWEEGPTFDICACCGTEAGFNDAGVGQVRKGRAEWLGGDQAAWSLPKEQPSTWSLVSQLGQVPPEWR